MKIFNRLLISLITCFLFIVAVGAEEPTTEDIQEPLVYNIEETTEGTSEVTETVIDKNVNELSQTTENVETTVDENASTENKIPPAEGNPTVESLPELATFEKEIIYNEDHTIATVAITYEGECDELTIANQEGIQELVNIGVYQVDMERSDWVNTIVFNILLNGAFYFDVNVWSAEDLIGTGTIVGYITGLNNDALLFEPNQVPVEYEIISSDVGSSDSRNMTLSYETNVSFTWSIPTELPMTDIEDDLTVTVNNSNLSTETALRIRIASNNNYNLINSESGGSLSYIITDQSGNLIKNDDVILDHLYNQASSSNTLHFDLTKMPVMSGKYEDTLCFTASVERLLDDLYSGQVIRIYELGSTHNLINTKIYGISKQDGTPTPENPAEIENVVNPTITIGGKNLLDTSVLRMGDYNGESIDVRVSIDVNNRIFVRKGTKLSFSFVPTEKINLIWLLITDYNNNILERGAVFSKNNVTVTIANDGYITPIFGGEDSEGNWTSITVEDVIQSKPQIEYGNITEYEPFISETQTATLPYTLNAIPVSSGGNVTIDGQQYIADYVDIENKKLVRNVGEADLGTLSWENAWESDIKWGSISIATLVKKVSSDDDKPNGLATNYVINTVNGIYLGNIGITTRNDGKIYCTYGTTNKPSGKFLYELETPTTIDLTDAEVQAFKDLYTYSPTTVVSASSEQLTPYIEFGLS